MKIFAFFLSLVLLFSFSVTAFADIPLEELGEPIPVEPIEEEYPATSGNDYLDMLLNGMQNNIENLTEKVEVLEDDISAINENLSAPAVVPEDGPEINPDLGIDENTPTAVNVYSLNPITPEDSTGLKAVLLSLIGDYDAVIVEYEYRGTNNNVQYLREIQPDYVWLCSSAIFLVVIYSVFRLGGALFRG